MKTSKETPEPVHRQKKQVALTREKILLSAKKIFARDGFEAAKLEEIAAAAGYTRGAFYANFKNKEELFVAVASQQITDHLSISIEAIRSITGVKPKIKELMQKIADTPEIRTWVILTIEFNLFVLRQPKQKKHVLSLYAQLLKGIEIVFEDLYKAANRKPPVPLSIVGIGYYSLAHALILQEMLNGEQVTPKVSADLLKIYLHAVLGDDSQHAE
jgi:AcrR family transcriptional regulator